MIVLLIKRFIARDDDKLTAFLETARINQ